MKQKPVEPLLLDILEKIQSCDAEADADATAASTSSFRPDFDFKFDQILIDTINRHRQDAGYGSTRHRLRLSVVRGEGH